MPVVVSDVLWLAASDARKRHVEDRTDLSDALPAVVGTGRSSSRCSSISSSMPWTRCRTRPRAIAGHLKKETRSRWARRSDGRGLRLRRCLTRSAPHFEFFFTTRSEGMGLGCRCALDRRSASRTYLAANNEAAARRSTYSSGRPTRNGHCGAEPQSSSGSESPSPMLLVVLPRIIFEPLNAPIFSPRS